MVVSTLEEATKTYWLLSYNSSCTQVQKQTTWTVPIIILRVQNWFKITIHLPETTTHDGSRIL